MKASPSLERLFPHPFWNLLTELDALLELDPFAASIRRIEQMFLDMSEKHVKARGEHYKLLENVLTLYEVAYQFGKHPLKIVKKTMNGNS